MKRTVTFLMAVLMLLVASVSVAATNETIVPQKMEPDTILIYDENCKPTIVQGGYLSTLNASASTTAFNLRLADVTESASAHEIAQIATENEAAKEQYDAVMRGETIRMAAPKAYAGMKVVYDEVTGDINNIYFPDANEPTGYSIHNVPREYMAEQTESVQSTARRSGNVSWTWGRHQNTLTYRPGSDSFLGTGRATYFVGTYGNRNNRLVAYDCATQIDFDYSKKGDKAVQIRNLDTDEVFTYHQADVGSLPDAIIDIWGEANIRELAGTADNEPTNNADNVRYYHERFSDQSIPTN